MDRLTPEKRSWNMSQIRGRNTRPEMVVRSVLHRMGYRFKLSNPDIPGKPDIILPKYKAVIFVHGCFWHRHEKCRYAYNPKSRVEFWQAKFDANVRRDKQVTEQLLQTEWTQLIVWECEIKTSEELAKKLKAFLDGK